MIIIIPLGGIGSRFKQKGYKYPKALIKVFGKPILYYLLDNLNLQYVTKVFIPYNREYSDFRFESQLMKDYPNIDFVFHKLEKDTRGAAETINIILKSVLTDSPVMCLDGDNFYSCDIIKLWDHKNCVFTFTDTQSNPIYSYIDCDQNGNINNIVEKEKISNKACTGAYGFASSLQLLEYTQKIIDQGIMQKGEFYTSTVIKEMISQNIDFKTTNIAIEDWHCLGTPLQIKHFCNNFPRKTINGQTNIHPMRICFDLVNTLVTYPSVSGDYETVQPIHKNIEFLKYLKTFGHTIIIYTSRRMKTHDGNVGKLMKDIAKITFETLDKFQIPYDEIYFGKPHANVYIDDLALNCFQDLEKNMGFYMDKVHPRTFNTIDQNIIHTYTKKGTDLSGEIYYYQNIPRSIKDLFPILFNYDYDNKWYQMEKVNGLTVTSLYLSELLTIENLKHIMNSINRIQSTKCTDEVDIYRNYVLKLKKRYKEYDYTRFPNHQKIYEHLLKGLYFSSQNLSQGKLQFHQ